MRDLTQKETIQQANNAARRNRRRLRMCRADNRPKKKTKHFIRIQNVLFSIFLCGSSLERVMAHKDMDDRGGGGFFFFK